MSSRRLQAAVPALAALLAGTIPMGTAVAAEGPGFKAGPPAAPERSMIRLGLSTAPRVLGPGGLPLGAHAPTADARPQSATFLGDVYLGDDSGLRATGGLLLGRRSLPWGPAAPRLGTPVSVALQTPFAGSAEALARQGSDAGPRKVPYIGLGYSTAPWESGWGFSADLGLMALQPGSIAQALTRPRSVDDVLRDLRLRPSLQLGVSYAF
jgi:hypothetical protein